MKRYFHLILTIAFILFTQCNTKSNKDKSSLNVLNVNSFKLKNGKMLSSKDWINYEIGDDYICIPSNWKFNKQTAAHFFCYLDNNNDNTYFTVVKYKLDSQNINFRKYLKESYLQLIQDTVELGEGYTVKKMIFNDKDAFYCEYYTKLDSKSYLTYSMLFEKYGFLYDVALKVEKNTVENYYDKFQDILYNLKVKGNPVFSKKDELEKIQIIDLSSL